MPNYDFRCKQCNNKFTVHLPIKERKNAKCPKCDSSDVMQRFTRCAYNLGFGPHRVPEIKRLAD